MIFRVADNCCLPAESANGAEGDGQAEVLYSDELMLRIFRGATGELLFETKNPSCTAIESAASAALHRRRL